MSEDTKSLHPTHKADPSPASSPPKQKPLDSAAPLELTAMVRIPVSLSLLNPLPLPLGYCVCCPLRTVYWDTLSCVFVCLRRIQGIQTDFCRSKISSTNLYPSPIPHPSYVCMGTNTCDSKINSQTIPKKSSANVPPAIPPSSCLIRP